MSTTPADPRGREPRRRGRAGIVASLLAIAVGGGAMGGVYALTGDEIETRATGAVGGILPKPDPKTLSGDAFATAVAGSCLDWQLSEAGELESMEAVDCAVSHRFEVAGRIDLAAEAPQHDPQFATRSAVPTGDERATIVERHCSEVVETYTDGRPVDPEGRYTVTVMPPSQEGWTDGDRSLLCGLQTVDRENLPTPTTGTFAQADQHWLWPDGTCLGITEAKAPGSVVDCANDHAVEIVSTLDVTGVFPEGPTPPPVEEQATLTADACREAAAAYLGDAEQLRQSTLVSALYPPISEVSWATGSRKVNCGLMRLTGELGFATLTGPAREGLLVDGQQPVAPTTTTIPPPDSDPLASLVAPTAPTEVPADGTLPEGAVPGAVPGGAAAPGAVPGGAVPDGMAGQ